MAAALCGPAAAGVTVTPAAKGYDIDIDGQASASELIEAIAGATGVEIKGQPEDATVGPNHLRNTSLERALRQLLPKAPFAIRFDADDTPETIIFLSPSQEGATADGSDGAGESDETDGSDGGDGTDPGDQAPVDDSDTLEDMAPDGGG
jgi:hypothetical protein